MINQQLNPAQEWDYTAQAQSYSKRPNYSEKAIEELCRHTGISENSMIADIGAGTGNLTVLLQRKVKKIFAVEPNQAMRTIGTNRTKQYSNIEWLTGTGEQTNLPDKCVDMTTFGSSFNTTDREKTLRESHRILHSNGFFACMWNNRDLTIPTQLRAEQIIKKYCPQYSHGTRREQQADIILGSGLFNHLYYFEAPQQVEVSVEDYIEAWRSVRNQTGWDLDTTRGREIFRKITEDMRAEFSKFDKLSLKYTTKVWVAKKEENGFSL